MGLFSWFSANEDGKVVAKTDVKNDGTVRRYEYTKPDDIKAGHGDKSYKSMNDFINDTPSFERSPSHPDSIERDWKGNGYVLSYLSGLPFVELQIVEAFSTNEYVRRSATYLLKQYANPELDISLALTKTFL